MGRYSSTEPAGAARQVRLHRRECDRTEDETKGCSPNIHKRDEEIQPVRERERDVFLWSSLDGRLHSWWGSKFEFGMTQVSFRHVVIHYIVIHYIRTRRERSFINNWSSTARVFSLMSISKAAKQWLPREKLYSDRIEFIAFSTVSFILFRTFKPIRRSFSFYDLRIIAIWLISLWKLLLLIVLTDLF